MVSRALRYVYFLLRISFTVLLLYVLLFTSKPMDVRTVVMHDPTVVYVYFKLLLLYITVTVQVHIYSADRWQ